jgi:hypothetical protein
VDTRPKLWQCKRRCDEESGDHLTCEATLRTRHLAHAMKSVRKGAAMQKAQTCAREVVPGATQGIPASQARGAAACAHARGRKPFRVVFLVPVSRTNAKQIPDHRQI